MIELFAVPADEDAPFLAAWAAEAPAESVLYRALREDVRLRFAALASGAPAGGVLLIAAFDDDRFPAAWERVREMFAARQGFLGARLVTSTDARFVAIVHWSSPLMYARAVREEGDVLAALPFPGHVAVYGRVDEQQH